ncbi:MAG: hypothetical protein IPH44_26810 [Myxococcales bacterium]|nr:hypothetical protein [Myxococcales bacterium]
MKPMRHAGPSGQALEVEAVEVGDLEIAAGRGHDLGRQLRDVLVEEGRRSRTLVTVILETTRGRLPAASSFCSQLEREKRFELSTSTLARLWTTSNAADFAWLAVLAGAGQGGVVVCKWCGVFSPA